MTSSHAWWRDNGLFPCHTRDCASTLLNYVWFREWNQSILLICLVQFICSCMYRLLLLKHISNSCPYLRKWRSSNFSETHGNFSWMPTSGNNGSKGVAHGLIKLCLCVCDTCYRHDTEVTVNTTWVGEEVRRLFRTALLAKPWETRKRRGHKAIK